MLLYQRTVSQFPNNSSINSKHPMTTLVSGCFLFDQIADSEMNEIIDQESVWIAKLIVELSI